MNALPYLPLILTPLLFVLVAGVTRRLAPNARGSGIPQVIAASKQVRQSSGQSLLDLLTAGLKLGLTIAVLFGGASVGREGPTVQVSAALMVGIHRLLRVPITAGVLIAGGAAGVAAAFNTALAVGAGVGNLLTALLSDAPSGPIILLAMVAYFVGVVRAPLTGVIILSETTASRGMILPLFVTALIADAVSALICRERLYRGLSRSFHADQE